jgi:hypothetical protein
MPVKDNQPGLFDALPWHDTSEATRWASRNMNRPFTILGLTS